MNTLTQHVFIDTNVFLSFYAFTGDDIRQLEQLVGLINNGLLKLYLPRQVADEFERNREKCIKDSIDAFAGKTLPKGIPRLVSGYGASAAFKEAIENAEAARDTLLQEVRKDAATKTLAADRLFGELRDAAKVIELTPEVVQLAMERKARGNPPGKSDGIGDQINWEVLLANVDNGATLNIVTKDGDHRSALSPNSPHRFLVEEWKARKGGDLVIHPEIRPFLNALFPMIKLRIDTEKNAAIASLVGSQDFASTHRAIDSLMPFTTLLTGEDVKNLAQAAIENTQIRWIRTDSDVESFYRKILPDAVEGFPSDLRGEVERLFPPSVHPRPEELPHLD